MTLVGRSAQIVELQALLDRAIGGSGGLVGVIGPSGSGRTAMLSAISGIAKSRGFDVLTAAPVSHPGSRSVWARLLDEVGATGDLAIALDGSAEHQDVAAGLQLLTQGSRRLIVVDDIDMGGPAAMAVLPLLVAQLISASTAVVVTAAIPLGAGHELRIEGLSEPQLAQLIGDLPADRAHAVWVVSRGLPGPAQRLAAHVRDLPGERDALAYLALRAEPAGQFLHVDRALVHLLERALARNIDTGTRARLLARLARELLGDPLAGDRRRELADHALLLARGGTDVSALVDVLDSRLHALWDPDGTLDRLLSATEIIALAQETGDSRRERSGLFWRFIALMESGQVAEAEQSLVAFERLSIAAGDVEAAVMALSRHAMLAILRGRFTAALALTDEVADEARRIDLPDAARLVGTLRGNIRFELGDRPAIEAAVETLYAAARHLPGHFYEATAARILATVGRFDEAEAELHRLMPNILHASGPRWLGAISDLAVAAVGIGDSAAARLLYDVLLPYAGRLVVWGGANACNGPSSYHLGLLATQLDLPDEAVSHLNDAIELSERIGALPALTRALAALSDALLLRRGRGAEAADVRARARGLAAALEITAPLGRPDPPQSHWILRRDGDSWLLVAGLEKARLADSRGMAQLCTLLSAPGQPISALDLAAGSPGLASSTTAPLLDRAALVAYRQRLIELDAELDRADAAGDGQLAARAEAERQFVLAQLRLASGLSGRVRRTTDEAERARINVTRTLRAAVDRITAVAPLAGAHLHASIRTGLSCRYEQGEDSLTGGPARWQT